jgi:hypothetical protein
VLCGPAAGGWPAMSAAGWGRHQQWLPPAVAHTGRQGRCQAPLLAPPLACAPAAARAPAAALQLAPAAATALPLARLPPLASPAAPPAGGRAGRPRRARPERSGAAAAQRRWGARWGPWPGRGPQPPAAPVGWFRCVCVCVCEREREGDGVVAGRW